MSSGSLGQGLSFAVGFALGGGRIKSWRIYALLSDGECDEGQTWEAVMAGAHCKVDNLTAIVDANGIQLSGYTKDIMNTASLARKFDAFDWNVIEVKDGHDINQVLAALNQAQTVKGKPTMIVAHTIKGKGVSFMENNVEFHAKRPTPSRRKKL